MLHSIENRPLRFAAHVAMGLGVAVVFAVVFGGAVMLAWNAVIPSVLSLPPLSYEQAVGLLVLGRILTGRFSHGGHHRGWHRHHKSRHGGPAADLYTAWWDAEGEGAFKEYLSRQDRGRASA